MWHKSAIFETSWSPYCQIWIIFTHLKLWIASARHNLAVKGLKVIKSFLQYITIFMISIFPYGEQYQPILVIIDICTDWNIVYYNTQNVAITNISSSHQRNCTVNKLTLQNEWPVLFVCRQHKWNPPETDSNIDLLCWRPSKLWLLLKACKPWKTRRWYKVDLPLPQCSMPSWLRPD